MDNIQKKVKQIIEAESEFLYNFVVYMPDEQKPLGVLGLLPFLSVYVDGVAKWSMVALKRSNPFSSQQKQAYPAIRQGIKLFENSLDANIAIITAEMENHEESFSSEYFGDMVCNGHIICNTYLSGIYLNITKLKEIYGIDGLNYKGDALGPLLQDMTFVGGRIVDINATQKRNLSFNNIHIEQNDLYLYDNAIYNMKNIADVCWLNLLCQVNYVLYFMNKLTDKRDFFVFRCAYIVYYYAIKTIENAEIEFDIDKKWADTKFRNALAHYGIKMALGKNKLISSDVFGGLTNYYFDLSYDELYDSIIDELFDLSSQLEKKLLFSNIN